MGEIGISRREFLYEIEFWEVRRIVRGYRRRDMLKHQLLAECVYAAMFSMRDPKGKTVEDIFPSLFPSDDDETVLDKDEISELTSLIQDVNSKANKNEARTK